MADPMRPAGSMQWPNVLAFALAVLVATFVVIMAVNMVIIPPLVVFAIVFAFLAYAVTRWAERRWLLILATVLVAVVLLSNLPFIAEDVLHPETPFTFVPSVVSILAAVLGILAGVAASLRAGAAVARPAVLATAALAVVALAVSIFAFVRLEDAAAAAGDVTVVAEDVEYPEALTASAGAVTFFLENRDVIRHTFVIDGQDVKEELPGSTNRRLAVTLAAGSYRFFCDVPGHETVMEGTLTVQ